MIKPSQVNDMSHDTMAAATLSLTITSVDVRKKVGYKVSVTGSSAPSCSARM